MANKKYREERIKEEKQRKYLLACGKLTIYPKIELAIAIAIILCFLLNWASVYNKDIRASEVGVSGFNVLFAALTGNYSKAEKYTEIWRSLFTIMPPIIVGRSGYLL